MLTFKQQTVADNTDSDIISPSGTNLLSRLKKGSEIKIILFTFLFMACGLVPGAEWSFKDGENSTVIREKNNSKLNGRVNSPSLCNWAREDDRSWFMTFQSGGAVIVPHADTLNFEEGFAAHIHFSCDITKIGRTNFASLFAKGSSFKQGYCIMVGRGGTLMICLEGYTPQYHTARLELASNVEYKLSVYAGDGMVRVFLNGDEVVSYAVTGKLQTNQRPLYIGTAFGYNFAGNIYSFSIFPYTPPPETKKASSETAEAPKFVPVPVVDPPGTVIVSDFTEFQPAEMINLSSVFSTSNRTIWTVRNVSFMKQSRSVLHPPSSPDSVITFNPGLKGQYDVYASLRAISSETAVQLNLSGSDTWYKLETAPVGNAHRNIELRVAQGVAMDGVHISLASGATPAAAYLGNIKFVPSGGEKPWRPDPAGKVTSGKKLTVDGLDELNEKAIQQKIASGYFRELKYVETRPAITPSARSVERGYILFEQPWMELLFENSLPLADASGIELKTSLAASQFEPLTIGIRALRRLEDVTLRVCKPFPGGISADIAVVEAIPKRTSNWYGPSEFVNAPQYLEKSSRLDIDADRTRQFWITLHVPENTPPGIYRAELELASGGHREKIPVAVNVYDLKLRPVDGYDIGFWANFGGLDRDAIGQQIKTMIDHGMTSLVTGNFFTLKGDRPENYTIDFETSTATVVGELCKKYGLRGNMIITVDSLNRGDAFVRLVKEFDDYANSHNWPKRIYTTYDEVTSHPKLFAAFIKSIEALHAAGFRVMGNHVWYKTSRPLQKEVEAASACIDVFINRFNTRNLFYVDSWKQMEEEVLRRGKKLYAYNSTNALAFAQTGSMRFAGGWFFRSIGKNTSGQLFCSFRSSKSCPYTDLDGTDWLYDYPPDRERKGGPAIDLAAFREGIDDLRYILTLEYEITAARKKGFTVQADAAEAVLDELKNSFDESGFYKNSVFLDSKWAKRTRDADGNINVGGELNIPNGWSLADYAAARHRMAAEIIKLQKLDRK